MASYSVPGPQPSVAVGSVLPQGVPPGPPSRVRLPGAGTVTGDMLADDAVGAANLSDPESMATMRWAPDLDLKHSPAGTTVHYVVETWAPSATDYVQGVTVIASAYPSGSAVFLGRTGTGYNALIVTSAGAIGLYDGGASVATVAAGYLIDSRPHRYTIERVGALITVARDGATLMTYTTAVAQSASAFAYTFGVASSSVGTHIIYDCELTDTNDATNNVFLRLDSPGQAPINACADPSDPRYSASTNYTAAFTSTPSSTGRPRYVMVPTTETGVRSAKIADASQPPRMATFSGLGASSTAGYWASFSHTATGTVNLELSLWYCGNVLPSAIVYIFGSGSTDSPRIGLTTAGAPNVYVGASTSASGTGINVCDGRPHHIRATLAQSGANVVTALYVDGRFVSTVTNASQTLPTGSVTYAIGSIGTSSQRAPGAIYDVRLLDLNTPANSVALLMDEPSGDFTNTYPSTTAAATATRRGYVPMRAVPTVDGRGMPWQNVGPLVYYGRSVNVTGITGVTTYTPVMTSDELDPTGSYAAGVFTAPCEGMAVVVFTGSMNATTLAGAIEVVAQINDGTVAPGVALELTATGLDVHWSVTAVKSMSAGQTIYAQLASLIAGNVYTVRAGCTMTTTFYPTPALG